MAESQFSHVSKVSKLGQLDSNKGWGLGRWIELFDDYVDYLMSYSSLLHVSTSNCFCPVTGSNRHDNQLVWTGPTQANTTQANGQIFKLPMIWRHISYVCTMLFFMHDDVIKWKHFPRYWPFVRGIHRSPVNSPHKGQWRGALMFTLICVRKISWVNNREAGDLRRYRTHYDVIVMEWYVFVAAWTNQETVAIHDIPLKFILHSKLVFQVFETLLVVHTIY